MKDYIAEINKLHSVKKDIERKITLEFASNRFQPTIDKLMKQHNEICDKIEALHIERCGE